MGVTRPAMEVSRYTSFWLNGMVSEKTGLLNPKTSEKKTPFWFCTMILVVYTFLGMHGIIHPVSSSLFFLQDQFLGQEGRVLRS